MADIETSVIISAQIDGLRSGMEAAASSVQAATDAMRAQLAGLGDIAQQAQSQLTAATGQVGGGIGALQSQAASLAGSMGAGALPGGNMQDAAANERLWDDELVAYQKFQDDKQRLEFQAVQASQRNLQSLMQPIQRASTRRSPA